MQQCRIKCLLDQPLVAYRPQVKPQGTGRPGQLIVQRPGLLASRMDSWPAPWTLGQAPGHMTSLMDSWPHELIAGWQAVRQSQDKWSAT